MVTRRSGPVLEHIRKFAQAATAAEPTDGQLLEQVAHGDRETAFSALVRRHGPMVLGVCRRILGDRDAADDAFQATFLVLFRKTRSLDRRGSVAGWLYTVAYHAALRARTQSARRQQQEKHMMAMRHTESRPEQVWQDLQPVLDEELNRLPEKYREAVLLCYLEEKTNEEAARRLGVSVGTIKSRLARARERLRTRLARRGVTLSSALLGTILAGQATAAVPAALIQATIQIPGLSAAALARLPGAVLAEGVLKTLFLAKLKIATACLLAMGVLAASAATYQALAEEQGGRQSVATAGHQPGGAVGQPPSQASPVLVASSRSSAAPGNRSSPQPTAGERDTKESMTVVGKVVDAAGQAVPRAQVGFIGRRKGPARGGELGDQNRVLGQTAADGQGRFQLAAPRTSSAGFYEVFLIAGAPGHGLGVVSLNPDADKPNAAIKLPREQIVRGRLLDIQGQPAADVQVVVADIGYLAGAATGEAQGVQFWNPPAALRPWPAPVKTDPNGRFELHGVNRDLGIALQVLDERFARQWLHIRPEEMPVTRTLAPAHRVEGRVVAADTGQPLPHAGLTLYASDNQLGGGTGISGTADDNGHFRLIPYPGHVLTLTAYPPDRQPYLIVETRLEWPKGAVRQEVELKLPPGVLVRGRLLEEGSGKPVAAAGIQFLPRLVNNSNLLKDVVTEWQGMVLSDAEGKFSIPVMPGPGHLLVKAPTQDYIHGEIFSSQIHYGRSGGVRWYPDAVIPLDLKPGTQAHDVQATLRRGLTVRGKLVGPEGQPVEKAVMACRLHLTPFEFGWRWPFEVARDGPFELHGCDPQKSYPVLFVDPKNRWGAAVDIPGRQAAGERLTVRLTPCGSATARFVDGRGQPLSNYRPVLILVVTPGVEPSLAALHKGLVYADEGFVANIDRLDYWHGPRTDSDGRCTLPALIPGATYRIALGRKGDWAVTRDFTVASGKTLDLGTIEIGSE